MPIQGVVKAGGKASLPSKSSLTEHQGKNQNQSRTASHNLRQTFSFLSLLERDFQAELDGALLAGGSDAAVPPFLS